MKKNKEENMKDVKIKVKATKHFINGEFDVPEGTVFEVSASEFEHLFELKLINKMEA